MESSGRARQESHSPLPVSFASGSSAGSSPPLSRQSGNASYASSSPPWSPAPFCPPGASSGRRLLLALALACQVLITCVVAAIECLGGAARRAVGSCARWLARSLSGPEGGGSWLWSESEELYEAAGAALVDAFGERRGSSLRPRRAKIASCRLRLLLCGLRQAGKTAILYRLKIGDFIPTVPSMGAHREEFSLTLQVHRPAPKAGAAGLEGSSSRGADRKAGFSMLAKERQAKTGQATSLQEALDRTCSATLLEEGFMSGADAAGGGATQTKVLDRDDERSGASANLCAVEKTKCSLVVWDLAGGEGLETRWRAMQEKCDAVVYAVDSTMFAGMERSPVKQRALEEARREILALFYEEYFVLHKDVKFLVLANKQDLRSAASASHILELLDLPEDLQSRLHILPCSAVSGEGLLRGLEWLASSAQCPCFSARDADRSVASTCDSWWHSAAAAAPKLSVDGKASAEMSGGRTVSRGESDQSPKEEQPIPAAGRGLPGSREVVQGAGRGGDSAEGTAAGAKHATARLTCADSAARKTGAGRGNAAVVDLLDDQQELQTGTEFAQKNASPVDIPADLDW